MEKFHIKQAKQTLRETIIEIVCDYAESTEEKDYLLQRIEELVGKERKKLFFRQFLENHRDEDS